MTHAAVAWTIGVGAEQTSAVWESPTADPNGFVFVCAHGAGGNMSDRSVLAMTAALRERGFGTVRFNFLYRALNKGRPDPMPRLLECFEAVLATVRIELPQSRLILGGRSMGGRAASVLVSKGTPCDGLLLLAYPLHPPDQPEKLRVEHLPLIGSPVQCINGTRDPFCTPDLMQRTLDGLGTNWHMHWLAEADHSFHVLKRSGRSDADVLAEAADSVRRWATVL